MPSPAVPYGIYPRARLTSPAAFEYRSEDYIQGDDPNSYDGNLTAIQFPVGRLINARRYIWSIFGEADIPIFGDQWSWPGMRSLQMTISERQDYYSDFGSAAKPKFAILYKPFNDFTVQARIFYPGQWYPGERPYDRELDNAGLADLLQNRSAGRDNARGTEARL